MQYSVHQVPTDDAKLRHAVQAPGDFVAVLGYPEGCNPWVRVGSVGADPIPLQLVGRLTAGKEWQSVFLDFDAVPGGHITLVIGSGLELSRFDPATEIQLVREKAPDNLEGGTLLVGVAPVPLGAYACDEVLVQADPDNTAHVHLGDVEAQPLKLTPGQSLAIPCANVGRVYVVAPGGVQQRVNWFARS